MVTTASTDGIGWHVQLNRLNSVLPEGQPVTVRFRARASVPTDMVVSGQVVGGDYHEIVNETRKLSARSGRIIRWSSPHMTSAASRFCSHSFSSGQMPGTVWIDHVTTSAGCYGLSDSTTSQNGLVLPVTLPRRCRGLPSAGEIRLEGTIRETRFADGRSCCWFPERWNPRSRAKPYRAAPKDGAAERATRLGTGSQRLTDPD